jgi:hypothetical protein
VAFGEAEIALAYVQDLTPRLAIRPSTALGLHWERQYREYRIFRPARRFELNSTQLSLFTGDE